MKNYIKLIENIDKFSKDLGGVFSYSDLIHILGVQDPRRVRRVLAQMIQEGVLLKIRRGIYTTPDPDLWTLSARLLPESYISMDNVIADALLIGTLPGTLSAVRRGGRKIIYDTPVGIFRYFSSSLPWSFGIQKKKNGIQVADPERAYLDLLYYFLRGARFAINPYHDIRVGKLKKATLRRYLKYYKNPKFVSHVRSVLRESP